MVNFRYVTSASDSVKCKTMPQNLVTIRYDVPHIKSVFISAIQHCALVHLLGNPALLRF